MRFVFQTVLIDIHYWIQEAEDISWLICRTYLRSLANVQVLNKTLDLTYIYIYIGSLQGTWYPLF